MRYILDAALTKEIDRYSIETCGIPSLVLMERAAYETANEIKKSMPGNNYIVLVGTGNNGGDGVAVARILKESGVDVAIYFVDKEKNVHDELECELRMAKNVGVTILDSLCFDNNTIFIDAIFGVGLDREVTGEYKTIIDLVNASDNSVVSVDIPSGINATTGLVMGCAIKANLTVTFGYLKTGLLLYPGAYYAGKVIVKNIGFAPYNIQNNNKAMFTMDMEDLKILSERPCDSNKGTFGKVLIIAGSKNIGGAAILSAMGALRAGCGMVKVFTHESNRTPILTNIPEVLIETYDEEINWSSLNEACNWADVCIIGPGLGMSDISKHLVGYMMENIEKPLIIDADAINIIAQNREVLKKIKTSHIFTPHLKEMERLTGVDVENIKKDIVDVCRLFVGTNKCICVLKDSRTIVAKFSEKVYINTKGNSGMATAGCGDVLTGIIAAIVARGIEPFMASCYGVLAHSIAGDKALGEQSENSLLASDIPKNLYKVI